MFQRATLFPRSGTTSGRLIASRVPRLSINGRTPRPYEANLSVLVFSNLRFLFEEKLGDISSVSRLRLFFFNECRGSYFVQQIMILRSSLFSSSRLARRSSDAKWYPTVHWLCIGRLYDTTPQDFLIYLSFIKIL